MHSTILDSTIPNPFHGVRIAITGGTSGLGLALVRHLLARGAHVAFVARRRNDVAGVAAEHARAHGIAGDVSDKDEIYPMAMQILGALGGLDVLVNNASDLGPGTARPARRHGMRGFRPRTRHQRPRPVPADQGTARRARRLRA